MWVNLIETTVANNIKVAVGEELNRVFRQQILCDNPALSQRAAPIDKYRKIKRETEIQCSCLR